MFAFWILVLIFFCSKCFFSWGGGIIFFIEILKVANYIKWQETIVRHILGLFRSRENRMLYAYCRAAGWAVLLLYGSVEYTVKGDFRDDNNTTLQNKTLQ